MCVDVCGCVWMCADVCGCVQASTVVCVWMCVDVCKQEHIISLVQLFDRISLNLA